MQRTNRKGGKNLNRALHEYAPKANHSWKDRHSLMARGMQMKTISKQSEDTQCWGQLCWAGQGCWAGLQGPASPRTEGTNVLAGNYIYFKYVCVCVCERARVCVCIYIHTHTHMYVYINLMEFRHTCTTTCVKECPQRHSQLEPETIQRPPEVGIT